MKSFFLLFVSVLMVGIVEARSASPLKVKTFRVGGEVGNVTVTVHKEGHFLGEPYVAEVYPSCGKQNTSYRAQQPRDVKSACVIYPGTIAISKDKKKITMKIQEVDYSYQSSYALKYPKRTTKTRCLPDISTFTFDLRGICGQ